MKNLFLAVAAIGIITFGLPALGLFNINFWGVKYEDAKRNVFEQSKSYNHGMQRDIQNLINSYDLADENQKNALKATIRHRLAAFDINDLPSQITNQLRERGIY